MDRSDDDNDDDNDYEENKREADVSGDSGSSKTITNMQFTEDGGRDSDHNGNQQNKGEVRGHETIISDGDINSSISSTTREKCKDTRSITRPVNIRKLVVEKDFELEGKPFIAAQKEFWVKHTQFENGSAKMREHGALLLTDSFVLLFKRIEEHKGCCLSFLKQSLKPRYTSCGKERERQFWATAYCKNELCTEFRFEAVEKIEPPHNDIVIRVYQTRLINHHRADINRRFFRAPARARIVDECRGMAPSELANKKLYELPNNIEDSGNRDDAPSQMLLRKMTSENNLKNDLDSNPLLHLHKLTLELQKEAEFM